MQKDTPKPGEMIAVIRTNQGSMKFRLFAQQVPGAVENFVNLAKAGLYRDVPFHRIIKDFMVQGGDFTNRNGTGGHAHKGPGTKIGDEYHPALKHIRGALAYAKTSMPNSIGSQFYIVHPENGAHFLDHPPQGAASEGYTVFGQLFDGFGVLDAIAGVRTIKPGDKPVEPQVIEDILIEEFNPAG